MASEPDGESYSIAFDGARQMLVLEVHGFWNRDALVPTAVVPTDALLKLQAESASTWLAEASLAR